MSYIHHLVKMVEGDLKTEKARLENLLSGCVQVAIRGVDDAEWREISREEVTYGRERIECLNRVLSYLQDQQHNAVY